MTIIYILSTITTILAGTMLYAAYKLLDKEGQENEKKQK